MRPYHAYTPDQAFLLPPSLAEAIDPDDPVHFLRQVLPQLDLTAIHEAYRAERGRPPFHPEAMVGLLLYGACRSIYSSRKLVSHPATMLATSSAEKGCTIFWGNRTFLIWAKGPSWIYPIRRSQEKRNRTSRWRRWRVSRLVPLLLMRPR